jgi:type 1 glutamine amidotransferase
MLWTVKNGSGRVIVDAMSHDADAMNLSDFVATFTRGAEWAATGDVIIPLAAELR